ncbi:MAG TPA: hypothetical protein PLV68_10360 [Ilumatobacteraceae bacterium]|nr:hypothetical protein [Ilumatobacteraceae bacterium]
MNGSNVREPAKSETFNVPPVAGHRSAGCSPVVGVLEPLVVGVLEPSVVGVAELPVVEPVVGAVELLVGPASLASDPQPAVSANTPANVALQNNRTLMVSFPLL